MIPRRIWRKKKNGSVKRPKRNVDVKNAIKPERNVISPYVNNAIKPVRTSTARRTTIAIE